jgi:hypothetical protein
MKIAVGGYDALVEEFVDVNGIDAGADALIKLSGMDAQLPGFGSLLSNEQFANALVNSLLPSVSETIGSATVSLISNYMTANPSLSRGAVTVDLIEALLLIPTTDANFGAARAAFDAAVALSEAYTGDSEDLEELAQVVGGTAASIEYMLTAGTDTLTGSSSSDNFTAYLSQNATAGGVSNTLSSADRLDGGAGSDSLFAQLVAEFFGTTGDNQIDVQPTTRSIESVLFEARDSGSNDVNANTRVTVDAKNMTGIDSIGSSYSDGDLVIENLTTLTDSGTIRNTEEITVVMDHTDNFNSDGDASDLTVLFDEDYLVAGQTSYDTTNYWIEDRANAALDASQPMKNINIDGISFTVDGEQKEIFISEANMLDFLEVGGNTVDGAGTWETYVELLQEALADAQESDASLAGLELSLDYNNTSTEGLDGTTLPVPAPAIVLTSTSGSEVIATGFHQYNAASGNYDVYGEINDDPQVTTDLPVTVNIELEKVGRDGDGGNLIVGAKNQDSFSDTDIDQTDGIEVFNIAVRGSNDQPSNLGIIASTNNSLMTVNVDDHSSWDGADLTVRNRLGGGQELKLIDATGFSGDFSLAMSDSQQAVTTKFGIGNDSYNWASRIDEDSDDDNIAYSISMGSGNDKVIATLDGDAVDARGESLDIDTGSGDDNVTLNMSAGVSYRTMDELHRVSTTYLEINTGSGNDRVMLNDYGTFNIDTDAGDDYVETDANTANGSSGTWLTFANTGPDTFQRVLYKAQLTVSFAGFEETVTIETTSANNFVADQELINSAIIEAIEANDVLNELLDYNLEAGNQQLRITSDIDGVNSLAIALYQPELFDSQTEVDGTSGSVLISSSDVADLRQGLIATEAVDSDDVSDAAEIESWTGTAANSWYGAMSQTGVANTTTYAGSRVTHDTAEVHDGSAHDDVADILDSVAAANDFLAYDVGGSSNNTGTGLLRNFSTIDVGAGDNIIVLDSNVNSSQTIRITETFSSISVVNFFDTATHAVAVDATSVGEHALDFTSYLVDRTDASTDLTGNTDSAKRDNSAVIIVDGAEDYTGQVHGAVQGDEVGANDVAVMRFDSRIDATHSFSGLTASNLLAALNNTTTNQYGNIDDGLLSAVETANLVGSTQNHILMVENDLNEGEYKVFHLTSTLDDTDVVEDGDFASATLLGTMDFGASVNLNVRGNATYEAALDALIAASDGAEVTPTFTLAAVAASADEGTSARFTVTASSAVTADTSFSYSITGVDAADITSGATTGTITILAGQTVGRLAVALAEDATTEGAETLTLTVTDVGTVDVTVNDTSTTPVASDTYSVVAAPTSVDEGSAVTFTISAADGAAPLTEGDLIAYTLSGIDASDTADALAGNATVAADGTATVVVTLSNDATTEGEETLTLTLDADAAATASVTVNDTSLDPVVGEDNILIAGTDALTGTDGVRDVFTFYVDGDANGAFATFGAQTITGYNMADNDLVLLVDDSADTAWASVADFVTAGVSVGEPATISLNNAPEDPAQSITIEGVAKVGFGNTLATLEGVVNFDVNTVEVVGTTVESIAAYLVA